jgi:hypothetical protein
MDKPGTYHGVVYLTNIGYTVLQFKIIKKLAEIGPVSGNGVSGIPFFVLDICKKAFLHRSLKK